MRTVLYMTTGRSLRRGVRRLLEEREKAATLPADFMMPANDAELLANLVQCFHVACPDLLEHFREGSTLQALDFPCAELESLAYWLVQQPDRQLQELVLFPTVQDLQQAPASEAYQCAVAIKEIILAWQRALDATPGSRGNLLRYLNEPDIQAFQFNPGEPATFSNQVADFLQKLSSTMSGYRQAGIAAHVFNITAGYKGIIPYTSLFGFLQDDLEIIYKSQNGRSFITIPTLPLAWDFKTFDEHSALVSGHTPPVIPPRFRLLFDHDQHGVSVQNGFGRILKEFYDNNRLRRFGYGARLMQYLEKHRQKNLEELIPSWEHIWIGDGIPETVEHSRGHNARLLVFAADLLEPLLQQSGFLSADELYLLICCLWLHDIGHTALTFTYEGTQLPIGRFPSLVRRFHNLTSAQLIRDRHYLPHEDRQIVALISQYNRQRLPLSSSDHAYCDPIFTMLTLESLEKVIRQENRNGRILAERLKPERALLLCALLRLLDGCDVQSDRVIGDSYLAARRRRLEDEMASLWGHLDELQPVARQFEQYNRCLQPLTGALQPLYQRWQRLDAMELSTRWQEAKTIESAVKVVWSGGPPPLAPSRGLLPFIHDVLTGIETVPPEARPFLVDYLSTLDRIAFKLVQEVHNVKHAAVKYHYLSHASDTYQFNFIFTENSNPEVQEAVREDIRNELTPSVVKILHHAGLKFTRP